MFFGVTRSRFVYNSKKQYFPSPIASENLVGLQQSKEALNACRLHVHLCPF